MCAVAAAAALAQPAPADVTVLWNPTDRQYENALVRLQAETPKEPFIVKSDGGEVPYQVEAIDGRTWIWVCSTFAANGSNRYDISEGKPARFDRRVKVEKVGQEYVLDNGVMAVKTPSFAESADAGGKPAAVQGPIVSLRLPDGRWVGRSSWKTGLKVAKCTAQVVGDGTLFGKVRLRYEFEGKAGAAGDVPAFAEVDVKLGPGWQHVEIPERHDTWAGELWEFEASHGWAPKDGRSMPFSGGPGSGSVPFVPQADRTLLPGGLPYQTPELFINLFPRWNQHYKDGWFFAATDGSHAVGVMPVLAGQWVWPHDNALEVVVRETGGYAGVRCPLRRGSRLWWLLAGTAESPAGRASLDYFYRYGFENLDKINRDFILGWEGRKGGWFRINPYSGDQINPTGNMRSLRKQLLPQAGKPGNLTTLYQAQVYFHPDTYGTYWNYWSPENPNFYTDYIHVPVLLTTQLKEHPRFEELRRLAEMRVHEDVHHSFGLPKGAGQECPGYMAGAWTDPEGICRTHLGFNPPDWPEVKGRAYFKKRITQPDGAIRRTLPMGDTHPGPDGPKVVEVAAEEVAKFATEELPGFGVIFNHRPGTPQETYLSFKAGPNRGHYHGDQLAIVLSFHAKPMVVDHYCSYRPRAGQDHMHNRVAFFTDQQPYLNMDGYERLIAFKTSAVADVAIGQVESDRLRATTRLPPELWDQRWPIVPMGSPLVYRRTVVFGKGGSRDYVVLRDQYRSPIEVGAAFCLHVRDDNAMALESQTGGKGGSSDGGETFSDADQDFEKLGVKPGWVLDVGCRIRGRESPFTTGHEVKSVKGNTLTVDRTVQAGTNQMYTLYAPALRREGSAVTAGGVAIVCVTPKEFRVRAFPWRHQNGKPESTQGVRLETRGREGEYVTVLVEGSADGVEAIPGGVKVFDDDVIFGGGLDAKTEEALVTVRRGGAAAVTVLGGDVDLDRFQGSIGLFVPDAGYPFGDIPDWLVRQRAKPPAWYEDYLKARSAP